MFITEQKQPGKRKPVYRIMEYAGFKDGQCLQRYIFNLRNTPDVKKAYEQAKREYESAKKYWEKFRAIYPQIKDVPPPGTRRPLGQFRPDRISRDEYILRARKRGYTLEEVGQRLGITRERVRQLENVALANGGHPCK